MTETPTESQDPSATAPDQGRSIEGHPGAHAVAVAAAHGVDTMFTLSGAHVFAMYDGAVKAEPPMRLLDVRHEQTAVFAAEATGKLTRVPGLAVLTAGPGVTNGVSAVTQAGFSGAPLVVVGGRAMDAQWGKGGLQEFDHVPLMAPITKSATTAHSPTKLARRCMRHSWPPAAHTADRLSSTFRWMSSSRSRQQLSPLHTAGPGRA